MEESTTLRCADVRLDIAAQAASSATRFTTATSTTELLESPELARLVRAKTRNLAKWARTVACNAVACLDGPESSAESALVSPIDVATADRL